VLLRENPVPCTGLASSLCGFGLGHHPVFKAEIYLIIYGTIKNDFYIWCMKKIYLSSLLLLAAACSFAQKQTPLYETFFSRPDAMEQDEGGGYHFLAGDNQKVFMSEDGYYKLLNKANVLIEEGNTEEMDDSFVRHGKWVEYFDNGVIKASGYYHKGTPYGLWKFYADNGKLREQFGIAVIQMEDGSFAFCKAGTEQVFYDNGKVKEEHFYRAEAFNGEEIVMVDDPVSGEKTRTKILKKLYRAKPFGTWFYYGEDGSLDKVEEQKD
jgi:antitoxin component YwqK of YwqJK toxin-antitoxin module